VVERVAAVALALRLDDVRLATLFSEVATRMQGDLKTPVIPTTAWASLQAAISQMSNGRQSGGESLVWATSGPLARRHRSKVDYIQLAKQISTLRAAPKSINKTTNIGNG